MRRWADLRRTRWPTIAGTLISVLLLAISTGPVQEQSAATPPVYVGLYNGQPGNGQHDIGRMTWSPGEATLARHGDPVITRGRRGSWNDAFVAHPSLIHDGNRFVSYATGSDGVDRAIGRWTSPDGISWTEDPANPILTGGRAFPGGVAGPFAHFDAETAMTRIWYSGILSDELTRIGYAEIDAAGNVVDFGQVLGPGAPNEFDDEGVGVGCVIKSGSTWYLYYAGQSGTLDPDHRTGYATFTDPRRASTYTKQGVIPAFARRLSIGGSTYRSNLLSAIEPYGTGYVGWVTLLHPTDGSGAERTFHVTSLDLTTFGTPIGPVISQAPDAWDSRSAENPILIPNPQLPAPDATDGDLPVPE